MPVDFEKHSDDIFDQLKEIRSVVKMSDCDGFFTRNCPVSCFVGTLMMIISLCHIASGINLVQSRDQILSNQAFINSLMAGAGGILGALMGHRYYSYHEKKLHEMYQSEVSDS